YSEPGHGIDGADSIISRSAVGTNQQCRRHLLADPVRLAWRPDHGPQRLGRTGARASPGRGVGPEPFAASVVGSRSPASRRGEPGCVSTPVLTQRGSPTRESYEREKARVCAGSTFAAVWSSARQAWRARTVNAAPKAHCTVLSHKYDRCP